MMRNQPEAAAELLTLAIDVGNSRTKWGVFDGQQPGFALKSHGILLNAELNVAEVPAAWVGCSRAVISNVAGTAIGERLAAILQPLSMAIHNLVPAAQTCGVKNGYTDPQQLGGDRWAAAIAAWQHYRAPCIIANAGTALTVDALGIDMETSQGIFLGGLIVPGFRLMQQSLVDGTARLTEVAGDLRAFPADTGAAMHSGILSAMLGAIQAMMHKLHRREGQLPHCLLSGGDAPLLAEAMAVQPEFAFSPVIADNLVLQGLLLIERDRT